jgi:hypothetical protein
MLLKKFIEGDKYFCQEWCKNWQKRGKSPADVPRHEEVDGCGHVGPDVDGDEKDVEKEELRNPEKMKEFWTCQKTL